MSHIGNTDAGHTGLWHDTRNDVADFTITSKPMMC